MQFQNFFPLANRWDLSFWRWQSVQFSRKLILPVWIGARYSTAWEYNEHKQRESSGGVEKPWRYGA